MKPSKKLSKSDREIWDHVRASITPIVKEIARHEPKIHATTTKARAVQFSVNCFKHSKLEVELIKPNSDLNGMMKSHRRRVERGLMEPSGRIDLHGLRLDDAHSRFRHFIFEHVRAHHHMLLVITGKGGYLRQTEMGEEISGVIRRAFPLWVHEPDIARLISHYCPAHSKHGGEGAYYVFIRAKARRL